MGFRKTVKKEAVHPYTWRSSDPQPLFLGAWQLLSALAVCCSLGVLLGLGLLSHIMMPFLWAFFTMLVLQFSGCDLETVFCVLAGL